MRRLHILVLAMFAVSALGAVLVASASAEVTLLAEWLVGAGLKVETPLPSEINGTLLLKDTKTVAGSAAVTCKGILDGTVTNDGEDETTEALNVALEKVGAPLTGLALLGNGAATGVGSECKTQETCAAGTAASPIEVWPLGLPWTTLLFLMANNEILDLIISLGAVEKEVGYELLCLVLALTVVDQCTAPDFEILVQNNATTGDAETPAGQKTTPLGTCTQSKEATGVNETVGISTITLVSGELLSVSSE